MKPGLAFLVLLPVAMGQPVIPPNPAAPPAVTPPAADPLDALVADSPFQSATGGRSGAAVATGPLELRSIVLVDGAYQFSVFDQGTGEASWIKIDERGHPFVARSFDRERDSLTVEHQGRTLVLALQPARMASGPAMAAAPPPPLPGGDNQGNRRNAPAANAGPGGPPASSATNPAEAQRLQNLADEIRRRRGSGPQMVLPKKN